MLSLSLDKNSTKKGKTRYPIRAADTDLTNLNFIIIAVRGVDREVLLIFFFHR